MHKHKIVRYMRRVVDEHIDPLTGEALLTEMAEDAAWHFDHDEWLDDETHDVWDVAVEVAEWANASPGSDYV